MQSNIEGHAGQTGLLSDHATGSLERSEKTISLHFGFCRIATGLLMLLVCCVLLRPIGASAQEFRGTISGSVTDPTGAVVPSASVEVKEVNTGSINHTISDNAGQYVLPFLPPGEYTITVEKAGFENTARNNITLEGQAHLIINLALKIGSAAQTVTVTGEAPLVNQADASIGQVISTESVADLPLNGRTPVVFASLSVGVITTSAPGISHPFDSAAANSWSIGGTPNQTSEVLLDGSPDLTSLGSQAYSPTQDSVQEVSVRPFDTDASFGHTIGGVINQISKGGTNALHGTMYEFNQVPNLDANLYFNGRTGTKLPVFHYNQYGLTTGGPVWIPRIFNGKDKLFFFFAWEGLRDSTPQAQLTTVPTDAERNGDFSALLSTAAGGSSNQLYQPNTGTLVGGKFTRTAVPNNCLWAGTSYCQGVAHANLALDPVAAAYLKLYPEPNDTTDATATGLNNYNSNAPTADKYTNEFGRLDYNLSARDHLFGDIRHTQRSAVKNDYFQNQTAGSNNARRNWGLTIDNVFTLNSSTVLDVRGNYTFYYESHETPAEAFGPKSVGLPSNLANPATRIMLPYTSFGTCGSFTSIQCLSYNSTSVAPTTSYQVFADVVKSMGKHMLKIGFDGRQYRLSVQNFGNPSGSFTFATNFVTSGTSGSAQKFGGDIASFLLGLPTSGQYDIAARADYHSYYTGSFVQDDWRVNDHFTVNLGLRFDIDTPYEERLGSTVNGFSPTAVNSASTAAATAFLPTKDTATTNNTTVAVTSINTLGGLTFASGKNGAVYKTNSGFFSPRIGFSYSPAKFNNRTVIRGGFGLFLQPETMASLGANGSYSSSAFSNQEGFSSSTSYQATNNSYFTNASTLSNPFPSGFASATGSSLGASTYLGSPSAITFMAPVQHDPYSQRWNIGFQQTLNRNTLLEVLYAGNHAVHLPIAAQNINATQLQYLTTNPYRDQNLATAIATAVPNPFAGLLPNGNSSFNGATTALSNLLVPYPQFGSTTITEQNQTIGQSYFHSGMIHIQQRASHGLTLTANYSFSKLTEADTFLNDQDKKPTHRISPFDHTHHFTVGGTYDLPLGRGKMIAFRDSKLMDELFGGFVLNSIYQFQTGPPIYWSADIPLQPGMTIKDIKSNPRNTNVAGSGNPSIVNAPSVFVTGNSSSCTVASGQSCDGSASFNGQYVNHYRTLPQTISSVRSDGFNNMDASILKNFKFTEKSYLQLRFETFNTLNHAVFSPASISSATSSSFGYVTSVPSTSQPRQVQLGGRIVF